MLLIFANHKNDGKAYRSSRYEFDHRPRTRSQKPRPALYRLSYGGNSGSTTARSDDPLKSVRLGLCVAARAAGATWAAWALIKTVSIAGTTRAKQYSQTTGDRPGPS